LNASQVEMLSAVVTDSRDDPPARGGKPGAPRISNWIDAATAPVASSGKVDDGAPRRYVAF
jgi:hypothetical protein